VYYDIGRCRRQKWTTFALTFGMTWYFHSGGCDKILEFPVTQLTITQSTYTIHTHPNDEANNPNTLGNAAPTGTNYPNPGLIFPRRSLQTYKDQTTSQIRPTRSRQTTSHLFFIHVRSSPITISIRNSIQIRCTRIHSV
jgi:hypothetical protein